MEQKLKYIPLTLLAVFGLKGLILGVQFQDVAALAVLGIVALLYEINIQNKKVSAFESQLLEHKKEIEQLKAFVTSVKLGSVRNVGQQR